MYTEKELEIEMFENTFGHKKRLYWMIDKLEQDNSILEVGCGTGIMITCPLLKLGFDIHGIDIDEESINYGKEIFSQNELDSNRLILDDIGHIRHKYDVIILSEVLEHIPKSEAEDFIVKIKKLMNKNSKLLITIPNGYGWFELESLIYFKLKIWNFFSLIKIPKIVDWVKKLIIRDEFTNNEVSTLSSSPHVRRFTLRTASEFLKDNGITVNSKEGSTLFAGPMSDLIITGFKPQMKINNFLGSKLINIASGFYIECILGDTETD
jgi:2-polyprenyl-3-methyl-5-hydroxy-6-metoxy-1,4-benzoquinol methylase